MEALGPTIVLGLLVLILITLILKTGPAFSHISDDIALLVRQSIGALEGR